MSAAYEVRAGADFWSSLDALRPKYTREQFIEIVRTVKDCIRELQATGHVGESGWSEHALKKSPYGDGSHFEFHTYDDDVLVVYFKRERKRVIRMVGVYDHASLPSG